MSIKAKLEAIIYAAEEPITVDQMAGVLKEAGLLPELMKPPASEEGSQDPSEDTSEANAAETATETSATAPVDAKAERAAIRARLREVLDAMIAEYASEDRGMEIRPVANGYRMNTKPEHHDVVRSFAKSLKPPIRLSLQALETLAVVAYKQPVTAPEISEIRGVDSSGVLATLIDRKLITTSGRKAVIGRPILYKTTKDFLLRFGLNDVNELPSMEEFEKMTQDSASQELFDQTPVADATGVPDEPIASESEKAEAAETGTETGTIETDIISSEPSESHNEN